LIDLFDSEFKKVFFSFPVEQRYLKIIENLNQSPGYLKSATNFDGSIRTLSNNESPATHELSTQLENMVFNSTAQIIFYEIKGGECCRPSHAKIIEILFKKIYQNLHYRYFY
jgi:hypothetical protein